MTQSDLIPPSPLAPPPPVPHPTDELLFESPNLRIRARRGFSTTACVVTFDSFTDTRTLDRLGFGETFFLSRNIDAIHVIARENDWYQYPEMPDAMARIHEATRTYRRVVTYGSSMGAYAALRFGGMAGAHCAIALSPQFSIDPKVAPFEPRWGDESRRFRPVWESALPFPVLQQAYVAYDPQDLDRRHVQLLRRECVFTEIPLPSAGHPVTGFLMEVGLLEPLVHEACAGALDVPRLVAEAWRRRERSAQYLAVLATRTRWRPRRIALLRRAVAVAPNHAEVRCRLAMQLGYAGNFEAALQLHREALEVEPGQPNLLLHYSFTLQRSGDLNAALHVMQDALTRSGGAALYQKRIEALRRRLQSPPGRPARILARLRQWWPT